MGSVINRCRLVFSSGPNRECEFILLCADGNIFTIRLFVFPVIPSVIHHSLNPSELTSYALSITLYVACMLCRNSFYDINILLQKPYV